MTHVSRPLIGLLVATVVFFALWTVALKPSSSSGGGANNPTSGAYQSAIAQAHQAVTTSAKASAADGAPVTSTPSSTQPATATAPKTATKSSASKSHATAATTAAATAASKASSAAKATASTKAATASAATRRVNTLTSALRAHKVVALLFYNGAAADDQAVEQELAAAQANRAKVVKLDVPISDLSRYPFITNQVQVTTSPTLVLIDRSGQATTIVGFADRFEIAQRISDALAVPFR